MLHAFYLWFHQALAKTFWKFDQKENFLSETVNCIWIWGIREWNLVNPFWCPPFELNVLKSLSGSPGSILQETTEYWTFIYKTFFSKNHINQTCVQWFIRKYQNWAWNIRKWFHYTSKRSFIPGGLEKNKYVWNTAKSFISSLFIFSTSDPEHCGVKLESISNSGVSWFR